MGFVGMIPQRGTQGSPPLGGRGPGFPPLGGRGPTARSAKCRRGASWPPRPHRGLYFEEIEGFGVSLNGFVGQGGPPQEPLPPGRALGFVGHPRPKAPKGRQRSPSGGSSRGKLGPSLQAMQGGGQGPPKKPPVRPVKPMRRVRSG